jgi:flagellar biosynthesis/type III secretory pathway chaperone
MTEQKLDELLENLSSIATTLKTILNAETQNIQSVGAEEIENLVLQRHELNKREVEILAREAETRMRELTLKNERLDLEEREIQQKKLELGIAQ